MNNSLKLTKPKSGDQHTNVAPSDPKPISTTQVCPKIEKKDEGRVPSLWVDFFMFFMHQKYLIMFTEWLLYQFLVLGRNMNQTELVAR